MNRQFFADGTLLLILLLSGAGILTATPSARAETATPQARGPAAPIQRAAFSKRSYCLRYTKLAIAAHDRNLRQRCGYTGDGWSNDVQAHTRWCLQAPVDRSHAATAARQKAILSCTTRTKTGYCAQYLRTAAIAFFRNDEDRCGLKGTHWRLRGTALKDWCLKVPRRQSTQAELKRAQDLTTCARTRRKGG